MPSNQLDKAFNKEQLSSSDKAADHDFDEINFNDKLKVECICPKCGQKHKLSLHWIGRGTPRKYCSSCKGGY